jgi:hypothetical protein
LISYIDYKKSEVAGSVSGKRDYSTSGSYLESKYEITPAIAELRSLFEDFELLVNDSIIFGKHIKKR